MSHARERMAIKSLPYWKPELVWENIPMSHEIRGGVDTQDGRGRARGNSRGLRERQMGAAVRLCNYCFCDLRKTAFHLLT